MKVLYALIDGDVTGGNLVAFQFLEALLARGDEAVITAPRSGPMTRRAEDLGVPVHLVETDRTHRVDAIPRLVRAIRDEDVDLVHTHESFAGECLVPLAARAAGVPCIVHAHVTSPVSANPAIRAYQVGLHRLALTQGADRVLAVSQAVADAFIEQGAPPDRTHVVHNGVPANPHADMDKRDLREDLGWDPDAFTVLHVGRLTESKGQADLIRATPRLLEAVPDARVHLVGADLAHGGAYQDALAGMARRHGVDHAITLHGPLDDVARPMAASDVLTLPSTAEGLPMVVLEAMAAGLPVVATPAGGTAEALLDGETGSLVPMNDPEALAEALVALAKDPERRQRMGAAGRARHAEHFTVQRTVDTTLAHYDQVLGRTPTGARRDAPDLGPARPRTIAVDAFLLRKRGKGVSRFLTWLWQALARAPPKDLAFRFYVHADADLPELPPSPGLEIVPVRPPNAILWDRFLLDRVARRDGCAAVLSLSDRTFTRLPLVTYLFEVPDHRLARNAEHGSAYQRLSDQLTRFTFRGTMDRAARVLTSSQATRRDLAHLHDIPEDEVDVVLAAPGPAFRRHMDPGDRHKALKDLGVPEPYLLHFSSHDDPRDNTPTVLRAYAAYRSRVPDPATLVIGGIEGLQSFGLPQLAEELGLQDHVVCTGFVDDDALVPLMQGALAYVDPSWYEGFGFQVAEALASEVPVICSDTTSLPEVAGDAALLIDPADADGLADALVRVHQDPRLRDDLRDRAARRARELTWDRVAEGILQHLREVTR